MANLAQFLSVFGIEVVPRTVPGGSFFGIDLIIIILLMLARIAQIANANSSVNPKY